MTETRKQPKIIAWLKPSCGWSMGVRAVFKKYGLAYEDRDIINVRANYEEMVRVSGQSLQPTVSIDGTILADVSGDEVEAWLVQNGYVQKSDAPAEVPTNTACATHEPDPATLIQIGGTDRN
jgi:glutaredoxin